MSQSNHFCPLCETQHVVRYHRDNAREYFLCKACSLVYVPPRFFLPWEAEKAHYELHENDPLDLGYRKFLGRLAEPLMQNLAPGAKGLDFGCGPGPTLSVMLAEKGFPTAIYDPVFERNADVWSKRYDFVTASEVVEHLHRPRFELERLWACLNVGGVLGIMTKRRFDSHSFADWHYKSDPTHVVFFADDTFHWLAQHLSAKLQVVGPDVVFLFKAP